MASSKTQELLDVANKTVQTLQKHRCSQGKQSTTPLLLITSLLICPLAARAGEPSPALSACVPNAANRLSSNNTAERAAVLCDLISGEGPHNLPRLNHDLAEEDYRFILTSVLESDLHSLPRETRTLCWMNICYLVTSLNLQDMAKEIAAHLSTETNAKGVILETLAQLNATETVPQIIPLLDSPEEHVRKNALRALVALQAKEATPCLLQKLVSEDPLQRYYALRDLVAINAHSAVEPIARLLEDPDKNIRAGALDALVKLQARDHADKIWGLLKGSEPETTETYAIAALIAFGDKRAIPLAIERATAEDMGSRYRMLELLVQLEAKDVTSAFVEVLKDDRVIVGLGSDVNIRRDIIDCLGKLNAEEAIPVLRDYVRNPRCDFLRDTAVTCLGVLRAKECVPDLLPLLEANNSRSSDGAAIALARTGDRTIWPKLVHSTHPLVFCELNAFLDPNLWATVQETQVQGLYLKPVDETAAAFTRQSGVNIVLYAPKLSATLQTPNAPSTWPKANTSINRITLRYGIDRIAEAFGTPWHWGRKDQHCFVFDRGDIHIMPVSQARIWWQEKLLRTTPLDP